MPIGAIAGGVVGGILAIAGERGGGSGTGWTTACSIPGGQRRTLSPLKKLWLARIVYNLEIRHLDVEHIKSI